MKFVERAAMRDALRAMGITDFKDIRSVRIDPQDVTVEYYERDATGHYTVTKHLDVLTRTEVIPLVGP